MKKFNKILLIDDDAITHFVNTSIIRTANISDHVKVAMTCMEALDYLKNECSLDNEYPDLIILDIKMPYMDGYDFLRKYSLLEIKEYPIIALLSDSSDPRNAKITEDLGIRFFNKPMTSGMLEYLLEEKKDAQKVAEQKNSSSFLDQADLKLYKYFLNWSL